jgi:hypothetical protein
MVEWYVRPACLTSSTNASTKLVPQSGTHSKLLSLVHANSHCITSGMEPWQAAWWMDENDSLCTSGLYASKGWCLERLHERLRSGALLLSEAILGAVSQVQGGSFSSPYYRLVSLGPVGPLLRRGLSAGAALRL